MRDPKLYLRDILDDMEAIEVFVDDLDLETFRKNDLVASAVIRKFEVIGEAAKKHPRRNSIEVADVRSET